MRLCHTGHSDQHINCFIRCPLQIKATKLSCINCPVLVLSSRVQLPMNQQVYTYVDFVFQYVMGPWTSTSVLLSLDLHACHVLSHRIIWPLPCLTHWNCGPVAKNGLYATPHLLLVCYGLALELFSLKKSYLSSSSSFSIDLFKNVVCFLL
ncbi:hypothetical protein XENTR_v10006254 [Xenopus tropicalis]|nr:hypothetical protein XENTR_v10006254 [Xenopus tropicalis]